MALLKLHKIMIATACLFTAMFAARCLFMDQLLLGVGFALITVGLGVYFRWFLRNKTAGLIEE